MRLFAIIFLLCVSHMNLVRADVATPWTVDIAKSKIGFVANYSGTEVKGVFNDFSAEIVFDPAALDKSRVKAVIKIASVSSKNGDRDSALQTAPWFDVGKFPAAMFDGNQFTALGKNKYHVDGALTIRDQTKPFGFDFTFTEFGPKPDDAKAMQAVMQAKFPLNRLEFGVGQGDWADEKQVAGKVDIELQITATRAP